MHDLIYYDNNADVKLHFMMMSRKVKSLCLVAFLIQFLIQVLLYNFVGYKDFTFPRLSKLNVTPLVDQNKIVREPLILLFGEFSLHYESGVHFEWVEKNQEESILYLSGCPYKCRFTMDKDRCEDKADMVVTATFVLDSKDVHRILENQKNEGQIWVGVALESPIYLGKWGQEVDDVFHWIATYRRDADIFWPNWSYTKRTVPLKASTKRSKKKLAALLVSHCPTHSQRELLVQTLQRYIPVDIYGHCGGKPCPRGIDCRAYLAANYKFYLAFENSLCLDYVTEKLFLTLDQRERIVPVTYSWMNDTTLAPPNSYIDATDFKSIKDLADYLKYLDKNDDEYNRYLEWKNEYQLVQNANDTKLCRACEMLLKYEKELAHGGERIKRRPSMLKWVNSLGNGVNFSYFKVAGNLIQTKNVCFNPLENKASVDWLNGLEY